MFAKKAEAVTPDERQQAKVVNFGVCYGMGVEGLRTKAEEMGIALSEQQAAGLRNGILANHPAVERWQAGHRDPRSDEVRTIAGRIHRMPRDTKSSQRMANQI